jgi:hypothetical protein
MGLLITGHIAISDIFVRDRLNKALDFLPATFGDIVIVI